MPANRSREHRREVEGARRVRVRNEVTRGLRTDAVQAAHELVYRDTAQRIGGEGVALIHITLQTALALAGMWEERRDLRASETATFLMLGGLAARAGATLDDVETAAEAAWELVLGRVRTAIKGGMWTPRTGVTVARKLEREAPEFAGLVSVALREGFTHEARFAADQAVVALRILDGSLTGDELGAAASAASLDASRPHGVALLVSRSGSSSGLEAAATEAAQRIPFLLDLGLGDTLPIHRRLVVPLLSPGQWLEARTRLHDIATRHHVLALAPVAAPSLAAIRQSYDLLESGVGWMLAVCEQASGIIDPACLLPAGTTVEPSAPSAVTLVSAA